MKRLCLFALSLCAALASSPSRAGVDPTTGEYRTDVVDLSVKVVGGTLSFSREYEANAWRFAPTWSALRLEVDALDDTVARIDRAGEIYEKIDSAGTLYRFDQRLTIRKTESGWRWADRDGNWMEYTASGQPQRFGNRIGNVVTLNYSADKLASVVDPMNRTVFTVTWNGNQLASVKDYTDREVKYGYTGNLLTQVTDVRGKVWKYEYSNGKLSKLIDPLNHATTITLSASGRARSVTDPVGAVTRYAFDYLSGPKQYYLKTIRENGEKQEVTETWTDRERELVRRDVNGVTLLTVARDGRNRIHTDYRGRRTTYLYDEFRNPTGVIYPDGSKVTNTYDAGTSNLLTTTNEVGTVTEHQYYANGLRRRMIEAKGTNVERITEYAYDAQGRLTTLTQVGDAVTQEAVTRYTYDAAGNVATLTDAEEGVSKFQDYDAQGNAWTRVDARQKRWTSTFDAAGHLLSQTNPLQHTTSHEFDDAGRKVKTTVPKPSADVPAAETTFSYDAVGRLTATTDALGGTRRIVYDKVGNQTEERDESDKTIRYAYDAFNRLIEMVDGNGNLTSKVYPDLAAPGPDAGHFTQPARIEFQTYARNFKYDSRNRAWSESDAFVGGGETRVRTTLTRFDSIGNVTETIDPAQQQVRLVYDALGRVVRSIDSLQGRTEYSYDDRDNLLAVTDANDRRHTFSFDRLDRTSTEKRPLGQTLRYEYDFSSNQTKKTDARDQITESIYDDAGRRIEIRYYEPNQSAAHKTVRFTYNNRNSLASYDDGTTSAVYKHDALERKLEEAVNYGQFTWRHEYSYYANGQKRSYTAFDGSTFLFGYDAAKQLQSLAVPGEGSVQFSDYRWLRPQSVAYPGGVRRTLTYDGMLRPETIRVADELGRVLMDHRYDYDEAGNISSAVTEHGSYRYEYDELNRVTVADYPNGSGNDQVNDSFGANTFPFEDDAYDYDSLGNRLTDNRRTGAAPWSYDENSRLLSAGNTSYEYNPNGSLIAERRTQSNELLRSYSYNTEERMSLVKDGQGNLIAEYYYDPFGRRLWKTLYPGAEGHSGGTDPERHFQAYSDDGFAGGYADAQMPPDPERVSLYVFAPDGLWGTEPILSRHEDWVYYAGSDHMGTPRLTVDANGQELSQIRTAAFGESKVHGEPEALRFAGQMYSPESGFSYNYFRDYDAESGRYVESDPIGLLGGMSLYGYAGMNPVHSMDPLGLCVITGKWEVEPTGRLHSVTPCTGSSVEDALGRCWDVDNPWPWQKNTWKVDFVGSIGAVIACEMDCQCPPKPHRWTLNGRAKIEGTIQIPIPGLNWCGRIPYAPAKIACYIAKYRKVIEALPNAARNAAQVRVDQIAQLAKLLNDPTKLCEAKRSSGDVYLQTTF